MCTSFLFRGNDTLIAMNYDNKGKNLKLAQDREDLFLVTLHSFGKEWPLFGIRSDGVMVNQQVVNECEAGNFRIGFKVVHTASLLKKMLVSRKPIKKLPKYLATHKIVSPPQNSLHVMIACADKQSCIIEPGRGIIWYPADKRYIVMSNCPVCDKEKTGEWQGYGVDRQLKLEEALQKAPDSFGIKEAFELLDSVHQTDENWTTEFSFVYSYNENKVYYCYDHKFDEIKEYQMKR